MTNAWQKLKEKAPFLYNSLSTCAKHEIEYWDKGLPPWTSLPCESFQEKWQECINKERGGLLIACLVGVMNGITGIKAGWCERYNIPTLCEGQCNNCIAYSWDKEEREWTFWRNATTADENSPKAECTE